MYSRWCFAKADAGWLAADGRRRIAFFLKPETGSFRAVAIGCRAGFFRRHAFILEGLWLNLSVRRRF
jgi:hypothetical protein